MPSRALVAVPLAAIALACSASAQPVQITEAQFTAMIAGVPATIETFEGMGLGAYPSPVALANGTYEAANPTVEQGAWCGTGHCLGENTSIYGPRTFSGFRAGTAQWGVRVLYASVGQVLHVTVIGNGGRLETDLAPSPPVSDLTGQFVGFADVKGLVSVTFSEPATITNYSFDNVVTASAIPEKTIPANGIPALDPAALLALALALAGLATWSVARR